MSTDITDVDAMREQFEHWFSDGGRFKKAIESNNEGGYKLMSASNAWTAWQAAWRAANNKRS